MLDRRKIVTWLSLGWAGAHAQGGARAQVPALSTADLGAGVAPGWRHQTLPKIERANAFTIVSDEGQRVLKVGSSRSASTWLAPLDVDALRLPMLRWQWKVSRSLRGSDLRTKQGDDYAAKVYVFFDLPLERLALVDRMRIQFTRSLSGADVPAAVLCYVWGHAQPPGTRAWNPYTDRVRMVVVDSGDAHAMQWQAVERDIGRDWAEAFSGPVPRVSGIAVGADTDNTGDFVDAWFGDLTFGESR